MKVFVFALFTSSLLYSFEFKGLEGDPDAISAVVPMELEIVQSLLPSQLRLQKQILTDRSHHPVILFYGRQRNLHVIGTALTFPSYLEYILAIPFVEVKGDRNHKTHMHLAVLYLNNRAAVIAGKKFYGMPKERARISWNGDEFTVDKIHSATRVVAAEFSTVQIFNQAELAENLSRVAAIYDQPLVQLKNGMAICTHAKWHFDTAKVLPVEGEFRITIPEPHVNKTLIYPTTGLDKSALGAFRFRTHWEMEAAKPCAIEVGK